MDLKLIKKFANERTERHNKKVCLHQKIYVFFDEVSELHSPYTTNIEFFLCKECSKIYEEQSLELIKTKIVLNLQKEMLSKMMNPLIESIQKIDLSLKAIVASLDKKELEKIVIEKSSSSSKD